MDSVPVCESLSQAISQISSVFEASTIDKFFVNTPVKSVMEINEFDRVWVAVVVYIVSNLNLVGGMLYLEFNIVLYFVCQLGIVLCHTCKNREIFCCKWVELRRML